jgi:precorrin-6B methylase 2
MNQSDLVALLQDGVTERGGRWADLGAGEGAFTLALAELLGPGAHITAVDKDGRALRSIGAEMGRTFPGVMLEVKTGDFRRDLGMAGLDGIVMATPSISFETKSRFWSRCGECCARREG